MKSLTLSEELAHKYTTPTGPQTHWNFVIAEHAITRPLPETLKALNSRVTGLSHGIFGAEAFQLTGTNLKAFHVCPQIGGTGWGKRWPGADHWEVMDGERTLFRTQNYQMLIRWFGRKARIL